MAVPVKTSPQFEHGVPQALLQARLAAQAFTNFMYYDVAADGKWFLINSQLVETVSAPISVTLNWPAALRR
jgi:hypothetical protein